MSDVDLENGTITINRNLNWNRYKQKYVEVSPKTKSSYRTVPMPVQMANLLKEYLDIRKSLSKKTEILFINKKGNNISSDLLNHKWYKFLLKYKLRHVTIHGLRHSYCSMQINENKHLNIPTVSKLMGHSQISTTLKYLHSTNKLKNDITSIFEVDI